MGHPGQRRQVPPGGSRLFTGQRVLCVPVRVCVRACAREHMLARARVCTHVCEKSGTNAGEEEGTDTPCLPLNNEPIRRDGALI